MTDVLIDTSVLIKWMHSDGESELAEARGLRSAHLAQRIRVHVLDLAYYEIGNVLLRALRWPASDVAAQLADLQAIVGPPVVMTLAWFQDAAALAHRHALSFYDAIWAAAAAALEIPLISADRQLLGAGLAESASTAAARLGNPARDKRLPQ